MHGEARLGTAKRGAARQGFLYVARREHMLNIARYILVAILYIGIGIVIGLAAMTVARAMVS